jgi:hypothetical protein
MLCRQPALVGGGMALTLPVPPGDNPCQLIGGPFQNERGRSIICGNALTKQ